MLDGLLSILTGGASGVLGTLLSFGTKFLEDRARHERELDLRRLDIELAKTEAAGAERAAVIEAESDERTAEWDAMRESIRDAGREWTTDGHWLLVWTEALRRMTRPGLTLLFVALTGAIYFTIADGEIQARVVNTVLYLATASTVWWFGGRLIDKSKDR